MKRRGRANVQAGARRGESPPRFPSMAGRTLAQRRHVPPRWPGHIRRADPAERCGSRTRRARPASTSATSTARAPTSIWSRRWARAGCSSTTTATAGSTSSWSMAGRSPIRRSRGGHGIACSATAATARSRTSPRGPGIQHRDYGMGACAGDYDDDGRVDLYVTNVRTEHALPQPRRRQRSRDVTAAARVGVRAWSASCAFADLDATAISICASPTTSTADSTQQPVLRQRRANGARLLPPAQVRPAAEHRLPQRRQRRLHRRQRARPASARCAATASASSSPTTTTTDGRTCSSPTTDAELPVPQHAAACGSRKTGLRRPASPSPPTARRAPAWASTPATTTATGGSTWWSPISTSRCTRCIAASTAACSRYATTESGIGFPTLPFVGFGVAFLDFDNDTQLDLAIANGHILDNARSSAPARPTRQRKLLFRNIAPRRFVDVGRRRVRGSRSERSAAGSRPATSTTTATSTCSSRTTARPPSCCATTAGIARNALLVRLRGAQSNRDGIGARIRVTTGARTQIRDVKAGSSYLSQNDLRAHFGLGAASAPIESRCCGRAGGWTSCRTCRRIRSSPSAKATAWSAVSPSCEGIDSS